MAAATSTLSTIQQKVRRLTRSPSEAQLTTDDLNQYINTFVIYDFPEHLRLFDLRTTFTFYTEPFIDVYDTNTTDVNAPLFDFKNRYITIHPPVFCAGFQVLFSQSREQFFSIYPFLNSIRSIGVTGDGTQDHFTGNVGNINMTAGATPTFTPVLRGNVVFDSIDSNGNGIVLIDDPTSNPGTQIANLIIPNDTTTGNKYGTINYVTGDFDLTFPVAPAAGATINSQTVQYVPAQPQAMLYYNDKFTLRPVPDQPYSIQMEAYIRPTNLLDNDQNPEINQWWQYIAYGAAKKVFEDRLDQDSVALILPEYKKQEALVLRKTIVQQTNERVFTIYTHQTDDNSTAGGWNSPW